MKKRTLYHISFPEYKGKRVKHVKEKNMLINIKDSHFAEMFAVNSILFQINSVMYTQERV